MRIEVGMPPRRNRDKQWNRAFLRRLPPPWTATFEGGSHGADGRLYWDPSHPRSPHHFDPAWPHERWENGDDPSIPLEVGLCPIETIFWHLSPAGGGTVARWPYKVEHIIAISISSDYMREFANSRGRYEEEPVAMPALPRFWA